MYIYIYIYIYMYIYIYIYVYIYIYIYICMCVYCSESHAFERVSVVTRRSTAAFGDRAKRSARFIIDPHGSEAAAPVSRR